jgi:hypothetical protein
LRRSLSPSVILCKNGQKWRRRESNPPEEIPIILVDNNLQEGQPAAAAPGQRAGDIVRQRLTINGMDVERDVLQCVIDAWPNLSPGVRHAICSIVRVMVAD